MTFDLCCRWEEVGGGGREGGDGGAWGGDCASIIANSLWAVET